MPSLEQKFTNTRLNFGIATLLLFFLLIGQATLYPLVINYNYTSISTNFFIAVLTLTIFVLAVCIYLCLRVVRDTFDEFIF